jgi:peptidoglycan/LPS O-acetylase OafA/YrhL
MLARALSDHLKEISWALFLIFLILICLFVIFGRELGFESVLWVCVGFAVIVLGLFGMIILGELLWVVICKVSRRVFAKNE